jgi:hypothetical protein
VSGLLTTDRNFVTLKAELKLLAPEFLVTSFVGKVHCRASGIDGSAKFFSVYEWAKDLRSQGPLDVTWTLEDTPRYFSIVGPKTSTSFVQDQTRVKMVVMKAARFTGWVQAQQCRAEAWSRIRKQIREISPDTVIENDHPQCSQKLFQQKNPPALDVTAKGLPFFAQQLITQRLTVTGVQKKLSLSHEKTESNRLTIVGSLGGNYIQSSIKNG